MAVLRCSVRKQEDADRITAETEGLPGRYTPLLLDVTDAAAVQAAAKVVDEALCGKTLTALINNAGQSPRLAIWGLEVCFSAFGLAIFEFA